MSECLFDFFPKIILSVTAKLSTLPGLTANLSAILLTAVRPRSYPRCLVRPRTYPQFYRQRFDREAIRAAWFDREISALPGSTANLSAILWTAILPRSYPCWLVPPRTYPQFYRHRFDREPIRGFINTGTTGKISALLGSTAK